MSFCNKDKLITCQEKFTSHKQYTKKVKVGARGIAKKGTALFKGVFFAYKKTQGIVKTMFPLSIRT